MTLNRLKTKFNLVINQTFFYQRFERYSVFIKVQKITNKNQPESPENIFNILIIFFINIISKTKIVYQFSESSYIYILYIFYRKNKLFWKNIFSIQNLN